MLPNRHQLKEQTLKNVKVEMKEEAIIDLEMIQYSIKQIEEFILLAVKDGKFSIKWSSLDKNPEIYRHVAAAFKLENPDLMVIPVLTVEPYIESCWSGKNEV